MREIHQIAREIRATWGNKASPHALPYLSAMLALRTRHDTYGVDSADSIILYFLSNAQGWRGEDAKRLKAELKTHL